MTSHSQFDDMRQQRTLLAIDVLLGIIDPRHRIRGEQSA